MPSYCEFKKKIVRSPVEIRLVRSKYFSVQQIRTDIVATQKTNKDSTQTYAHTLPKGALVIENEISLK